MKKQINFLPKGAGIIIKVVEETKSGIILGEKDKESAIMSDKHEVLAIGNKCEETKVGDMVNFITYAQPVAIIVDDEKYYVLQEREILGYYK